MSFAENVYQIIRDKKMCQSAVARGAGMDPKAFNALLRGRKQLREEYILPIANSLGVSPNDLFGISNS